MKSFVVDVVSKCVPASSQFTVPMCTYTDHLTPVLLDVSPSTVLAGMELLLTVSNIVTSSDRWVDTLTIMLGDGTCPNVPHSGTHWTKPGGISTFQLPCWTMWPKFRRWCPMRSQWTTKHSAHIPAPQVVVRSGEVFELVPQAFNVARTTTFLFTAVMMMTLPYLDVPFGNETGRRHLQ